MTTNPIELFGKWYEEAQSAGLQEPTAMSLATADKNGSPSVRMVLLKKFDENGFVFFTNYNSQKGKELQENPRAALCFYWPQLKKQIRIEGSIEKVTSAEADEYFHSRHPESRIGALASDQSSTLDKRETLLAKASELRKQYGDNPPRPEHWSGFRVIPDKIEFWREGEFRLHDRELYSRRGSAWDKTLLYP